MEKHRAIPKGYMTVGELAKRVGVTVRTLQHYDKEGFFSPSAESEGGRRLYTQKDLVNLHQILCLKHLGFSLQDIKKRILPLDKPEDVAKLLTEQAAEIKMKIQNLKQSCEEIELLREEILQMQSVDFEKYAAIITNLRMKNRFYWLIKDFDEQMLSHTHQKFTKVSGDEFSQNFNILVDKTIHLHKNSVPHDSEVAQELAKEFWNLIMEFTNGDMSILSSLMKIGGTDAGGNKNHPNLSLFTSYIEKVLDVYFTKLGVDPLAVNILSEEKE